MSLTHEELSEKIKQAKEKQNRDALGKIYGIDSNETSMIGKALRVGTEMVSAILVGCLFGYWIDKVFKISPFGMVFMMFLGFIASILNIYRMEDDLLIKKSHEDDSIEG